MDFLKCRVCGHGDAESLGQIPDCGEFAGQKNFPPIKGGELWLCKNCGSMFRHPTLSTNDYISFYQKAPSTVWVVDGAGRSDFVTIYRFLESHIGGSILDVGCYSGNFLACLPEKFKKYGLEPSGLASKYATSKGIDVLGETLDELEPDLAFDVVVSIDVVEHVLDVEKFLSQALAHVKENGLLIISTGNPDCFFWKKVYKSKFWYNLFAEHVTFPSYNYYIEFSKRHELQLPEQIRFKYTQLKFLGRILKTLRYFSYSFSPACYQALRKVYRFTIGGTVTNSESSPVNPIGIFTDHHVIVFRKKDCIRV